jgi:hypothetical protein
VVFFIDFKIYLNKIKHLICAPNRHNIAFGCIGHKQERERNLPQQAN